MHLRTVFSIMILLPAAACSSENGPSSQTPAFAEGEPGSSPSDTPVPESSPAQTDPLAPAPGTETSTDGVVGTEDTTPLNPTPPVPSPVLPPETEVPAPSVEPECAREFTMPTFAQLQSNPRLPDPFTFLDGTKVTSKADWACRRKEINLLAQEFIYGRKPGAPDSLQATFSGGTLDIAIARGGQSMQLAVSISRPNGAGPFPGVMSVGGGVPQGVANINFGNVMNQIAVQVNGFNRPQGAPQGDFYRLYPDFQSTGSLMAWAWGASRIIDALEATSGHDIDTTKLSALGCSRNGKAAATMALFDERFALVAAQSPGSGTTSGWRIAQDVQNNGGNVQTAQQIYGENTWLGTVFQPFGQNVDRLPIDQHLVLALAWPRPLIMMEGTNDSWNCPSCTYQTLKYTQLVYQALGSPDDIGFPQPDHGHCAQAGTFAEDFYNAFVDRFLRGDESVSTAGLFTDGNFNFDANRWQDGDIPRLE